MDRIELIKIPFNNQNSDFCKLLRRFPTLQDMHATLASENRLPIVMYGDHVGEMIDVIVQDIDYDAFNQRTNKMSLELNGYRLVHLKYHDLFIEDGVAGIIVESHGGNKYIPTCVNVLWHKSDELINDLLNNPKSDIRMLWFLTAYAFIVPTFGSFK